MIDHIHKENAISLRGREKARHDRGTLGTRPAQVLLVQPGSPQLIAGILYTVV